MNNHDTSSSRTAPSTSRTPDVWETQWKDRVQNILREIFGYHELRAGQQPLVENLLSGRDTVGIMPTGAGKSLCFQIPALLLPGITLVISPLIALMKDQVEALLQAGVAAAYINSSLTARQTDIALQRAKEGRYKIIYVAPERLLTPRFLEFAQAADISLVSVDEAHCISQWGQNFRPGYLKIADFLNALPKRPVTAAFTATATPQVRDDIISILGLKHPAVMTTSFDRPNLFFQVVELRPAEKLSAIRILIQKNADLQGRSGIVYCAKRDDVNRVCETLQQAGILATRYHAGLTQEERQANQDAFLFDQAQVMVATNAFGMGIDKSNVAYVIHYNMPQSMEAYYQEAGRAGRDGQKAYCILLYAAADVALGRFFIMHDRENDDLDEKTLEQLQKNDMRRLYAMKDYCSATICLRKAILRYFGENTSGRQKDGCKKCSVCDPSWNNGLLKQLAEISPRAQTSRKKKTTAHTRLAAVTEHTLSQPPAQYKQEDVTLDAQKIISCIYRIREAIPLYILRDVLLGEESEASLPYRTLSTYGLFQESSAEHLEGLFQWLIQQKILLQQPDSSLLLTAKSAHVLKGEEKLIRTTIISPKIPETSSPKSAPSENAAETLYQRLRALRSKIAHTQGLPAYIIFSDVALQEMCEQLPRTPEEFLEISGVGQVKLERYGEKFIGEIRQFLKEFHLRP